MEDFVIQVPQLTESARLPGDISGSDKYFDEDIVEPAIGANNGTIAVPTRPGLGWEPVVERIERRAVRRAAFP